MNALVEFFACYPGLALIADEQGVVRHLSRGLAQRLGDRFAVGSSLASLSTPADRQTIEAFLRDLAGSPAPGAEEGQVDSVACTVHLVEADGRESLVHLIARRSSSGSIHVQVELVSAQARIERTLFRTIMHTLDIVLWAVDDTGKFVFHDGKALATAGLEPGQFLGMNVFEIYPPELVEPIRTALTGTPSHYTSEAHGVHWETWNIPLKDDAGRTDHCAGLTLDVSPVVRNELELKRQIETIRAQQQAIHELSAPVLRIWEGVLTVPLIGTMDAERASDIGERLLAEANRSKTRFVILDLTGVEALDTSIANHLLRLVGSLRLLGVEGMISGISPVVAMTMVGLGIELATVRSHRSLGEALRYCMLALDRSS